MCCEFSGGLCNWCIGGKKIVSLAVMMTEGRHLIEAASSQELSYIPFNILELSQHPDQNHGVALMDLVE